MDQINKNRDDEFYDWYPELKEFDNLKRDDEFNNWYPEFEISEGEPGAILSHEDLLFTI